MQAAYVEATTSTGINVAFKTSDVTDWSWNRLAKDTPDDPALEVVFDRGETPEMTQKVFFFGHDAKRVVSALTRFATNNMY